MYDTGLKVGILESNVELLTKVCTKMEGTMEKTQEVASNLAKIVAVHEEKMLNQEKNLDIHKSEDASKFDKLSDAIEDVKSELLKEVKALQKQLDPIKRLVWLAMGGISVIMVVLQIIGFLLK